MPGLVSFAAGFCAQRALRGRTLAGARVFFEPGAPVEVSEPTITIHAAQVMTEMEGRRLFEAAGDLILRFELFLPCGVVIEAGQKQYPLDTSSSLSLPFALFWRQCEAALAADQNIWSALFRSFALKMQNMRTMSDLISIETGQRVAARIVDIKATSLSSPRMGLEPSDTWAEFIEAMRADSAEIASVADLIESVIRGGIDLLDWQSDFALLGLSQSYAATLGLNPNGDINASGDAAIETPADPDYI